MQTAVLIKSEIEQFHRNGFVVLKGAFAREDANAIEEAWWKELFDLYGIKRDDRSTWFQPARDLRGGKASPMQTKMHTDRVRGAMDDLLGEGVWKWPKHWGRAIATFPMGGIWNVPGHRDRQGSALWHWDSPVAWHRPEMSAVFVFSFIGEVAPGGGGTSILAGSHRLLKLWDADITEGRRASDAQAQRARLWRAHPWLVALTGEAPSPADRRKVFMEDGATIEGISLRVVELTGEPGDMVLCHPTIVHTASSNCGTWPRLMRIGTVGTERLARRLRGQ
jgi:hypothetical protein